jgi:hypothetical protein
MQYYMNIMVMICDDIYIYIYTSRYIHMHSGNIMGILSIVLGCNIISWEYWTADINLMRI